MSNESKTTFETLDSEATEQVAGGRGWWGRGDGWRMGFGPGGAWFSYNGPGYSIGYGPHGGYADYYGHARPPRPHGYGYWRRHYHGYW